MNICTLCDSKYIKQAELMIQSSKATIVHLLCLDDEVYYHFVHHDNVITYHYNDFDDENLQEHFRDHTWEQHCWMLASYFMLFLRKTDVKDLIYVDADIYFYKPLDLKPTKSIGLIEHRFKKYDPKRKVGHYNVGVIYFKDDKPGNECLEWWSDMVMNDNNPYFSEYGTCGDQKYLEMFQVFWPNDVEVLNVGHAAPWNVGTQLYNVDNGNISFQGNVQPLTFFHFSHFSIGDGEYRTSRNGEWHPENVAWAKKLYDEYYKLIKEW